MQELKGGQDGEQIKVAQEYLQGKQERLILRLFDSFQLIEFNDLMYCKSDAGYTTFYLSDGRKIMASKPIKEFENQLPNSIFIRTHQSYIVNINYVDSYDKVRYVYLKNKEVIPVSLRKKEEFISKIFNKNLQYRTKHYSADAY